MSEQDITREAQQIMFIVPGQPQPKARARVVNGHGYTPAKTKVYERLIANCAAVEIRRTWPLDARYSVEVLACFSDARRRDLDNVLKSVLDALNNLAYADDSQVDWMRIERGEVRKTTPRTIVIVKVLT